MLLFPLNGDSMNAATPKTNSRKAQAEERRHQILDVALEVFAAKGFQGTSVKDIAQAADISLGLMYHYFASKDDLFLAVVEHHSFLPQLKKILTDTQGRPFSQVFNDLGTSFLDLLEKKSGLVKIFFQEIQFNEEIAGIWANLMREGVSLLQKYLDLQVVAGNLRHHNTEVTARSMFSIVVMYHLTRTIYPPSLKSRNKYLQEIMDNLLNGIKA
jgi:AcrR family transcriptional regulator